MLTSDERKELQAMLDRLLEISDGGETEIGKQLEVAIEALREILDQF